MAKDTIDMTMNTMMHNSFKREIGRIRSGVESLSDPSGESAARLAKRWNFFSGQLQHHHEAEDRFIWPLVRERAKAPDEQVVVDAMEAEHEALHQSLDELNASFTDLGAGRLTETSIVLDQLADLNRIVTGHCDHEEQAGAQLATTYVRSADLTEFHKFTRSGQDSAIVLPWVCDGASEADQAKVWGMLPGFVRLFAKPIMTRKYRAWQAEVA